MIREVQEETGLLIEKPRLCGIKKFHKQRDGKRYIVFLYIAERFSGELHTSGEGRVFWHPLDELVKSDRLIGGFDEMLRVFMDEKISEVAYQRTENGLKTIY